MSEPSPSLDTLACPYCGEMNPEDANFCQNCGQAIGAALDAPEDIDSSATMAISIGDLSSLPDTDETEPEEASAPEHVIAFKTDIGNKHHVNQDAGSAWTWVRDDGTPVSLLAVADGVSAGQHSEAASRLAIDVVYQRLAPVLQDASRDAESTLAVLVDALKEANHQVASRPHFAVANADATTVVVVFIVGTDVAGAWVGDSRVYRVSGGTIEQLTTDHSWAQAVVSRGLMTVDQASRDPRAHMIMRWLGPPDQDDPGVDSFRADVQPGDTLFCCSDGLYGYFAHPVAHEEEMAHVFEAHGPDLQGALDELVETALARGGHDNITVAALRLTGDAETRDHETQEIPALSREDATQTMQLRFSSDDPVRE